MVRDLSAAEDKQVQRCWRRGRRVDTSVVGIHGNSRIVRNAIDPASVPAETSAARLCGRLTLRALRVRWS
jgi:hypothetical protein